MTDIRSQIVLALGERSARWLAKQPGVKCSNKHISAFLRGESDITSELLGGIFDALGLRIVAKKIKQAK